MSFLDQHFSEILSFIGGVITGVFGSLLSIHIKKTKTNSAKGRATVIDQSDLSPVSHPVMSRVRSSFEPVWLGGATGRGAKPPIERSVPSRCFSGSLSLA